MEDFRSSRLYHGVVTHVCMPLLRNMDPEAAHNVAIRAAAAGLSPSVSPSSVSHTLATRVWGVHFQTPIGLAAGFDKQVRWIRPGL